MMFVRCTKCDSTVHINTRKPEAVDTENFVCPICEMDEDAREKLFEVHELKLATVPAICYFCNKNESSTTRYTYPICGKCNSYEFRAIAPPGRDSNESKAMRWKLMISMAEIGEEARRKGDKE